MDADRLAKRFGAELERVGGKLIRLPDEEAAERWLREASGKEETGVDRADLLIAETGTVVRSYATREESRVSLVPPRSVFLATPDLLVPDLGTALTHLAPQHEAGRAYTILITGPSRTADIEKELVIPAHGPRDLVVLLHG